MRGGAAAVPSHRTGAFPPPVDAACMVRPSQWLQNKIPGSVSKTVFLNRLADAKHGLNFRRSLLLPLALFPPRTASGFKDWARVVLRKTVLLLGSRNPPPAYSVSFLTFS